MRFTKSLSNFLIQMRQFSFHCFKTRRGASNRQQKASPKSLQLISGYPSGDGAMIAHVGAQFEKMMIREFCGNLIINGTAVFTEMRCVQSLENKYVGESTISLLATAKCSF